MIERPFDLAELQPEQAVGTIELRPQHRVQRQVVNAFPRTDVDTALAQDAFRLVDVEKLLGTQLVLEIVAVNQGKG